MQLAIQEAMLPGRSALERFQRAQALGLAGVELDAGNLDMRIEELADAIEATGVQAAAIHMGHIDGYLSPERDDREAAISQLRQTMASAVDLGVEIVTFVPQWGPSRMPDLTPYRARQELDAEMMIWLLRTVSDLAYALGVTLAMQPVNRFETDFMHTLTQAGHFCEVVKDHPHIRIAASLFDMALEEDDPIEALKAQASRIAYMRIADSNRRLPGEGLLDFKAISGALSEAGYQGWLTLASTEPGQDAVRIYAPRIAPCLEYLRTCGMG